MNHPKRIDLTGDKPRSNEATFSTVPLVSCRVSYRDRNGVEHSVPVSAVNRYHAFALALIQLKKCSWSNPEYSSVDALQVQIVEGNHRNRRFKVTREQFEAWLAVEPKDKLRTYVLMLLQRIPPDRDFKRGLQDR